MEMVTIVQEALVRLRLDPDDDAHLEAARRLLEDAPVEFAQAVGRLFGEARDPSAAAALAVAGRTRQTWRNVLRDQVVQPLAVETPASIAEVAAIVDRLLPTGLHVRAAGAGHSFSDVVHTTGVLVDTARLSFVRRVDAAELRPGAHPETLVCAGAGTRIRELNAWLDENDLGLENMGGYDGQAIVGAICTGTHGSGVGLGPLASQVVSLVMVDGNGRTLRVEPANGVTDREKLPPGEELVQDDDTFRSVVVGVGCMGIVCSIVLRARGRYCLSETRRKAPWSEVRPRLLLGEVLREHRHYELLINPYATLPGNDHLCLETLRDVAAAAPDSASPPAVRHWMTGLVEGSRVAEEALLWFLDAFPALTPGAIDRALDLLETKSGPYVDVSHRVFDLGPANRLPAISTEMAVPLARAVDAADRVLELAAQAAAVGDVYQTAPVSFRFVAESDQYLAMQYGEDGQPWCMIEMPMLVGTVGGLEVLERFEDAMIALGGRAHWGQRQHVAGASGWVREAYPRLDRWLAVRRKLDPRGVFSNAFTARAGL